MQSPLEKTDAWSLQAEHCMSLDWPSLLQIKAKSCHWRSFGNIPLPKLQMVLQVLQTENLSSRYCQNDTFLGFQSQ